MQKKGFTVVELAASIIIIGIILLMAIKGYQLFNTARYKTEASKILKFERAMKDFEVATGYPVSKVTNYAIGTQLKTKDVFIDRGLLTNADISNKANENDSVWTFHKCTLDSNIWKDNDNGNEICAVTYTENNEYASTQGILVCFIEALMDDKSIETGEGRLFKDTQSTNTIDQYEQCLTIDKSILFSYAYKVY